MRDAHDDITIRRGLPPGTERAAAALYWDAFGRKLGPALGPAARGIAFVAAHLQPDRVVVALRNERVVAVAGYQHAGRPFVGGTRRDVVRHYGLVSAGPRLGLLALLHRRPAAGQLVMDGIAVHPDERGRGVGTRLLDEVLAVAADHGYGEVRLDVIDVNPRARALYERRGFVVVRIERTPCLRGLLGFGAVITMRHPVARSAKIAAP